MLDWAGRRKIRRSSTPPPWLGEPDAERLLQRACTDVDERIAAASRVGTLGRALRVLDFVEALRECPFLLDAGGRARFVHGLRGHLIEHLEEPRLEGTAAVARASTALELLLSIAEVPHRLEHDYPGIESRARDIGTRLGVGRRGRTFLAWQFTQAVEGDCCDPRREPHLALGWFAALLGGESKTVSGRMARLARRLLGMRVRRVDAFLWFFLLDRARQVGDAARLRATFARNGRAEVEAALRELMTDEHAVDRMMHSGEGGVPAPGPLQVLQDDDRRGLDLVRASWGTTPPRCWVHVGDSFGALAVRDALDLPRACRSVLVSQSAEPSPALPLARDPAMRLLEDDEIERMSVRLRRDGQNRCVEDPAAPGTLSSARGKDGPMLLSEFGGYLGVVRPSERESRRRAAAMGVSGARYGAMSFAEGALSALRSGDTAAFFGTGGVPYLRAATWISLAMTSERRVRLTAVAWRQRFPGLDARWEVRGSSGST